MTVAQATRLASHASSSQTITTTLAADRFSTSSSSASLSSVSSVSSSSSTPATSAAGGALPPRALALTVYCFLSFVVCSLDRINLAVAIIPMSGQFGWSASRQGLVQSVFFGGYMLTMIWGGVVADVRGGRSVLCVGVVVWSLCTVLTPLAAPYLPLLLAVRVALGAGEGVAMPAMNALVAADVPAPFRARSLSFVYSGMYVGSIVGLLVTPGLLAAFGWPAAFYTFGAFGFLWAIAFLSSTTPSVPPLHQQPGQDGHRHGDEEETDVELQALNTPPSSDSPSHTHLYQQQQQQHQQVSPKRRPRSITTTTTTTANYDLAPAPTENPSSPTRNDDSQHPPGRAMYNAPTSASRLLVGDAGGRAASVAVDVGGRGDRSDSRGGVVFSPSSPSHSVSSADSNSNSHSLSHSSGSVSNASTGSSASGANPSLGEMFRSVAVWAIIVAQFCFTWGYFVLVAWLPTYLYSVHGLDIQSSALYSALPWFCMFVFANVGGFFADFLLSLNMDVTFVRKLCQAIGFTGPIVFLACLLTPTAHRHAGAAIAAIAAALSSSAFSQAGVYANHQDIGPRVAGTLLGISSTFASIPGLVGVWVTGVVLDATDHNWNAVFALSIAFNVIGLVFYTACATSKRIW